MRDQDLWLYTHCPVTGLPIVSQPHWLNIPLGPDARGDMVMIGDRIVYCKTNGYVDLEGVNRYIRILNEMVEQYVPTGEQYVILEDYALHKGVTVEGRNAYIKYQIHNARLKGLAFMAPSPLIRAIIQFSRVLTISPVLITMVNDYVHGMLWALSLIDPNRIIVPISHLHSNTVLTDRSTLLNAFFTWLRSWFEAVRRTWRATSQKPATVSQLQSYAQEICTFVSDLESGVPVQGSPLFNHPEFRLLCDSLQMMEGDFQRMSIERDEIEQLIRQRNHYSRLRADFWKRAANQAEALEPLLVQILKWIGQLDSVNRCVFCWFPGQDSDCICTQEWVAADLKSLKGVRLLNIRGLITEQDCVPLNDCMQGLDTTSDRYRYFQQICENYSLNSTLILPIRENQDFKNVLIISSGKTAHVWDPEQIGFFQEIAHILGVRFGLFESRQTVRQAFSDLEQKVQQRTLDLDLANRVLKKSREEAEYLSQVKTEFLAKISHDIRTPLTVILGLAELITSIGDVFTNQKQAAIILTESRRMRDLINELLDLNKIESGKLELDNQPFDLEKLMLQILSSWQVKAYEKNIKLELEMDVNVPRFVKGDALRLTQILVNLVSNAIKFTETGEVKIRLFTLYRNENLVRIRFEVNDTGIGIPAEQLSLVFDSYHRIETNAKEYEGTGLGTTIAKQLVELMNGKIGVESELGKGSLFWFECEFFNVEHTQVPQVPSTVSINADLLKDIRILVAEDYINTQLYIQELLTQLGCRVRIASDGAQALDLIQQESFDMVLMDLKMPVMDGYEATAQIRACPGLAAIPIIAMSANAFEADKNRAIAAGITDFLPKPMDRETLVRVLSQWIGERAA